MELRQIYYVLKVAKCKNFTKAANELYITQSNISQQINALERALDTKLFERNHHNVVLTSDGEKFCRLAKNVVDSADSLLQEFDKETESSKVVMNIGVFPFSFTIGISSIIRYFFKTNMNVVGAIRVADNYVAYDGIKSGELDFAIVKLRPEDKLDEFDYIPLIEEELMVIISKNNPISSHKAITSEDLSRLPVLVGEKKTNLYDDFEKIYKDRNAEFNVFLENTFDRDLLLDMIANDDGVTFATESTSVSIMNEYIVARPLEKPVEYNTYLIYKHNKEQKGIYKAFIEYLLNGIVDLKSTREEDKRNIELFMR